MSELDAFKGKLLTVYAHSLLLANMHIGDQKGLYTALKGKPLTASELARKVDCDERYIEEWLLNQTVNGIITRIGEDGPASSGKFHLSEEKALCLATPSGPHDLLGGIQSIIGCINQLDKVCDNFTSGGGIPWALQNPHVHTGCRRFFAPLYQYLLTPKILPAIGKHDDLQKGIRVADIGCGHGISTITMAKCYPKSRFFGFDYDPSSIAHASKSNDCENAEFTTESAVNVASEEKFDFICVFDCFHDMNDPEGAIAHFAEILKDSGCVLLIEPLASETIKQNENVVGQIYSGFSPICCLQCAKHESKGTALGTLAAPSTIQNLFKAGGFSSCDIIPVPEAQVNRVFVAKKK